jgi:GWxTD domain-containing protein
MRAFRARVVEVGVVLALVCVEAVSAAPRLSADHTQWPKAVFDWSYVLIASKEEWAALDTLTGEARSRFLAVFWKRRDPTPTTPENEFLKQFEERVDFALTRFPVRSQPEPWDRRGEVYIRFGPPDDMVDSSFDAYYEKWYYFGLNLKFMFEGGSEGQRIIPFHEATGEVQSLPRYQDDVRRMEAQGVLYVPPLGELPLKVALDWYPFRRADGGYDVYVTSAAPGGELARRSWSRDVEDFDYVARVVVFDSVLGVRWLDSTRVQETRAAEDGEGMILHQWTTTLQPGLYVVAAEWDDARSPRRGVASFDRWLVPYDTGVELDLSPLVVAAEVKAAGPQPGVFVRNGKEIVAMPSHVFKRGQSVAFYHEVYNLRPDSSGTCSYRVEYSLYREREGEAQHLFSNDYRSNGRETYQAGTLPAGTVESGTYILEARTTDLVGNITKTALANFTVE